MSEMRLLHKEAHYLLLIEFEPTNSNFKITSLDTALLCVTLKIGQPYLVKAWLTLLKGVIKISSRKLTPPAPVNSSFCGTYPLLQLHPKGSSAFIDYLIWLHVWFPGEISRIRKYERMSTFHFPLIAKREHRISVMVPLEVLFVTCWHRVEARLIFIRWTTRLPAFVCANAMFGLLILKKKSNKHNKFSVSYGSMVYWIRLTEIPLSWI